MGLKTQGTHLYFVDRSGVATLVKLACPTGINGINSGARDQTETTDLDATDEKTFIAGLGNPGQVSVPFVLNPLEASHQTLFDLKASGDLVDWIALLSDGVAVPTLDSDFEIEAPTTRSSFKFEAYVADVAIDVASNDAVRGTLTLQRSGAVVPTWKTP